VTTTPAKILAIAGRCVFRRPGCAAARLIVATCYVLLALIALPARGHALEGDDIATVDRLFARVALVRKEIELIRLEMGRPRSEPAGIVVTNASSREVFFVARNMFAKANRLSFELTRDMAPTPEIPIGEILPLDVSVVVTAALMRLRQVKTKLDISQQSSEPPTLGVKTPSDVYISVFEADRQLDLLLDQPLGPSDVFQEVTLAVGYAARLLARFPGQSRIPEAPSFERHKVPAEVYRRLLGCFEHIRSVAQASGLEIMELHTGDRGLSWVTSADNYELASILVAELAYFHSRLPGATPPRNVYYPGRKFPSDVYQRAGILENQLRNLSRLVARNPDWLKRAESD